MTIPDLPALLAKLEWRRDYEVQTPATLRSYCPVCQNMPIVGHAPDCELAAVRRWVDEFWPAVLEVLEVEALRRQDVDRKADGR